jgi:cystinosin
MVDTISEPLLSNNRNSIQEGDDHSAGAAVGATTNVPSSSTQESTQPSTQPSRYNYSNLVWLFGPWLIGITLGLLLCSHSTLPRPLNKISASIGWVYFAAWSISFYPQIWTNYRRKSVVGLSIDFQILNMLGFLCYTIYNSSLYFIPAVRQQYQAIHSGQLPAVHSNDVAFSIHAFLLTSVTLTQSFLYRNNNNNNNEVAQTQQQRQRPATASLIAVAVAVIISTIWALIIVVSPSVDPPPNPCTKLSCPAESIFTWLTWLYFLSGIKFLVTLVKYIPQVILNCQRQSTEGWNVWNVLLDFEGGILSLAQQIIDAAVCGSLIPLIGSPIKFGLSLVSMVFDVLFIVQHFVLYPDWKKKVAGEAMALDYERIV